MSSSFTDDALNELNFINKTRKELLEHLIGEDFPDTVDRLALIQRLLRDMDDTVIKVARVNAEDSSNENAENAVLLELIKHLSISPVETIHTYGMPASLPEDAEQEYIDGEADEDFIEISYDELMVFSPED